ncbi:hypothetical protein SVAN01_05774 [Stagonosporopsis vannaccii]|nr:hypothetical protein SVAN01_05774 [Stagonosporopsis vannaccii]
MGVYGLAAARSSQTSVQATSDGRRALLPAAHSSPSARSAIQRRPGCTFKRSPAPRRCTHGRRLVCTGTGPLAPKAAAILSPPPPVSLFPQSLSLFPSLRQLSRTCTTQRVPCVALPIAAFPARLPRPSSNKLARPLKPHPAAAPPRCPLSLVRTRSRPAVVVRGLRAFVAPQPSPGPPSAR